MPGVGDDPAGNITGDETQVVRLLRARGFLDRWPLATDANRQTGAVDLHHLREKTRRKGHDARDGGRSENSHSSYGSKVSKHLLSPAPRRLARPRYCFGAILIQIFRIERARKTACNPTNYRRRAPHGVQRLCPKCVSDKF